MIDIKKNVPAPNGSFETVNAARYETAEKTTFVTTITANAAASFSDITRVRAIGLDSRKSAVLPDTSFEITPVPTFMAWIAPARMAKLRRYPKKP